MHSASPAASSSSSSSSSSSNSDYAFYLRTLQSRAADLSLVISRLTAHLREREKLDRAAAAAAAAASSSSSSSSASLAAAAAAAASSGSTTPSWNKIMAQFSVLSQQSQTLYDDMMLAERHWSSRAQAANSLFFPLSSAVQPALSLRIKPVPEAEMFEKEGHELFQTWQKQMAAAADAEEEEGKAMHMDDDDEEEEDASSKEYRAADLRDQINDFNAAVLKLARFAQHAAALPLPGPVNAAAGVGGASTMGSSSATSGSGSNAAAAASTAASREQMRERDKKREEENELMRTLETMMKGKQTRIIVQQTLLPNTQQTSLQSATPPSPTMSSASLPGARAFSPSLAARSLPPTQAQAQPQPQASATSSMSQHQPMMFQQPSPRNNQFRSITPTNGMQQQQQQR